MTQIAGSLLLKMLKYFEAMLNISEFFRVKEIENYDWFLQMSFHESSNLFHDQDNKAKLVPASISYFLELFWEKNKLLLKKCHSYNNCYDLSALN